MFTGHILDRSIYKSKFEHYVSLKQWHKSILIDIERYWYYSNKKVGHKRVFEEKFCLVQNSVYIYIIYWIDDIILMVPMPCGGIKRDIKFIFSLKC